MKPLSFILVGSGWRAMFYVRIARRFPEQFDLKYVLCRTEEKAARLARENGVPATVSPAACEAAEPDFVVVAVSKPSGFAVAKEWARKGYPVVMETPAGCTVEEMKELWDLKEKRGAKIQVAEQYHRYPVMAAGLKAIEEGKLGDPYAAVLTVAHDYHGASLIRRMLGTGFEPVTLRGNRYQLPVTETDSRYGPVTDGRVTTRPRDHVVFEFASGKTAFYDFSGVIYHSFIRSRHVNVQGQKGEWNDGYLRYLGVDGLPATERIEPYLNPRYQSLETKKLREICSRRSPALTLENEQDEYAIATMLFDLRDYLAGGPEVYPLAEALEDAYLWLLIQNAAENPWTEVKSRPMPWEKQKQDTRGNG